MGTGGGKEEGRVWSLGDFGDLDLPVGEGGEIIVPSGDNVTEIWVPTYVNGVGMPLLMDTGTSHTILTLEAYCEVPVDHRPPLTPSDVILKQATGSRVAVHGRAVLDIRVGDRAVRVSVRDCGASCGLIDLNGRPRKDRGQI